MKIYNSAGAEILDIQVDDTSYLFKGIQETGSLTLYFSSTNFIEIPALAYCQFQGESYYLTDPANFKKHGTRNFEYTLVLESTWSNAKRYKVKDITDGRLKFFLTAKPEDHLQLLVDNMNLRDAGWAVGECIDAPEKVLNYNHIYVRDALQMIADEFKTEWEVDGKTIHLRKVEYYKDNPLALSYGKGNGFRPGVGRMNLNDSRPVEVLYVQGGERNIDYSKYNSKELLLPKSQQLVYNGRTYVADAAGLSIKRADKAVQFHNEDSLDLSHIYPSRVGTISSVVVVNADKHFYDIIDNTIPEALNYNDCRIKGEKATIVFQSGMLAGREFDIEQTDNALTGYVHAERRIKIVPQEVDGVMMPDATFIPAVGDKYAIFNISLPDAYVCDNTSKEGASWDMFREAAKYLNENEDQKFSFTGELDGIWAKQNWLVVGGKIKPGSYVSFSDAQFQTEGVLVRMISVKQLVNNPYSPIVELSNATSGTGIGTVLKKIDANEVMVDRWNKETIRYAKRGFRDSKQTAELLANAMKHYSEAISPVAVQTMSLLLGDESLQFRFVDDMLTPVTVAHNVQYNPATKVLNSPGGIIQHMTLGIDSISSSHAVSEYKFWNVAVYNSPALVEADKSYYLYAKVSKSAQLGTFLLNETPIGIEDVAGYYHLLVGILNSENDEGDRSYVDFYGYSEFLPGRITTSKIVSPEGKISIDLVNETCEMQGVFKFSSGEDVEEAVDNVNGKIDGLRIGGRNLLIGSSNYFFYGSDYPENTLRENGRITILNDNNFNAYGIWLPLSTDISYIGKTVTLSLDVKVHWYNVASILFWFNFRDPIIFAVNYNILYSDIGYNWKRISCTITIPSDYSNALPNGLCGFGGSGLSGTAIEYKNIKCEYGDKATDWTPAPEDIAADATAKANAAQTTAQIYALAQANLAETTAKAYADGIVTEEEQRAIADATGKADAARVAAINAAATDATAKANAAQAAAQSYALAQANLAETTAKAYADGIVTEEEQRAIADATSKADAARVAAINAAAADATAKANAAQAAAQSYALAQANLAETTAKAYADGIVTEEEQRAIADATSKADAARVAAINAAAADATAKVVSIQVGGRNLLQNSHKFAGWTGSGFSINNSNEGILIFDGFDRYVFSPLINEAIGKMITVSFKAKIVGAAGAQFNLIANFGGGQEWFYKNLTENYNIFSYTFIYQSVFVIGTMVQNIPGAYFYLKDVKTELGNKATDWTPAPEDIDAKFQASAYLTEAIKNDTTINGGLLSTTLMKVGAVNNAGQWVEKAGINGAGTGDNTPRIYAGGTLQQAIQRIAGDVAGGAKTVITEGGKIYGREVELYGSMATAPSGERIVIDQVSKSVIIYDASDAPKTIITSQAIPSLASLLAGNSASVNATVACSLSAVGSTMEDSDTVYSAILTLPATSNNYTITTPSIECFCEATSLDAAASSAVNASLVLPDGSKVSLGALTANSSGQEGDEYDSQSVTIPSQQFSSMPAGNYKIELNAFVSKSGGSGNSAEASIYTGGNMTGESMVNVSRIFKDGMFLINDASNYTYISPTTLEDNKGGSVVRHNQNEKSFGVLAVAYVDANNNITPTFGGAVFGSPTNNGSGLYTIPHNLGHTNYRVIVSARGTGNITATVVSESANNCQVQLKSGGSNSNQPFNIMLVG